MQFPTTADAWTLEIIEKLVSQGYLETDSYDFKAEFKDREQRADRRLTATACAFANTKGGFVIFGVKDLGDGRTAGRIEGIDQSSDLAKEFGEKVRGASPNIFFEFGNPPIRLKSSDKVVFVVHIPLSPNRPHASPEGFFYYRTNEGNRLMSYEQVRDGFLRYEERRTKVKLLLVELATLEDDAKAAIPTERGYSLAMLDTTVINSILPDVYSMIQDDAQLVKDLSQIRRMTAMMNAKIREIAGIVVQKDAWPLGPILQPFRTDLESRVNVFLPTVERVIGKLEQRYNLKRPF